MPAGPPPLLEKFLANHLLRMSAEMEFAALSYRNGVDSRFHTCLICLCQINKLEGPPQMNKTLDIEELKILLGHAQEDVAAMEAIHATSAAAAYYAIECTIQRFIDAA